MQMNLTQANRCVALAQHLDEEVPPEEWHYPSFEILKSYDVCKRTDNSELNQQINSITCNTAGCAIGKCVQVFPDKFRSPFLEKLNSYIEAKWETPLKDLIDDSQFDVEIKLSNGKYVKNTGNYEFEKELESFFGLKDSQISSIFMGIETISNYGVPKMNEVTAKMVAQKLFKAVEEAGYSIVKG